MRRNISLVLILILLFTASGCAGAEMTVVFSDKFISIAGQTPEGWKDALDSNGPEQYLSLTADDTTGTVVMNITAAHQKFWLNTMEAVLADYAQDICQVNPAYKIEYSNDYTSVDFYYDPELPAVDAVYYVMGVETYCACMQLFNGTPSEEWVVNMTIYNSDTGKIVTSGSSNSGLSYTAEDWEASK